MMKRIFSKGALGGLLGLALMLAASPAAAQESGAEVWARACGRCHRLQPPAKYDADFWQAIMGHMALNARLTFEEEAAVRDFLMGAARPLSLEDQPSEKLTLLASADPAFIPLGDTSGAEVYEKQCAPCHGDGGKGDGPAAVAFTPRPSNLTDAAVRELSDEELLETIAKGRGAMPGFRTVLSPEQLQAVLSYVRNLSSAK